jgi:hypothetical protein
MLLSVSTLCRSLYKISNTVMPIILAGTIEFVHNEQVSTLFTFCLDKFYCTLQI